MLERLYSHDFFRYFEMVCDVPRGSGYNKKISDFLKKWAQEQYLEVEQDSALNIIMRKPASPGYEQAPVVILQGHMDMVCEKEADIEHDFTSQGLELCMDEKYIYARGTTLGGDDGIAIAYGMAVLAADTLEHPAIELVVTTDEETGMDGAKALDVSTLYGTCMINLDSEEEGSLLSGCAGGMSVLIHKDLNRVHKEGTLYQLTLNNLQGGHSGSEIDKHRSSATLLMARLLWELPRDSYDLVSMQGGNKDNAIPRDAVAQILVPAGKESEVEEAFLQKVAQYQDELGSFEPDLTGQMVLERTGMSETDVLTEEQREDILFLLLVAPNAVQTMSPDVEGLVESSLNMGILTMDDQNMEAHYSLRSSLPAYKQHMADQLQLLAGRAQASYEQGDSYPAWVYRKESPLRDVMVAVYEEMYQAKPRVEAIHAGLECGLISDARPDIDIVSIGPDILDIHTPKEKLDIQSAIRVFNYLTAVLKEIH